jgi:hypothetical protein
MTKVHNIDVKLNYNTVTITKNNKTIATHKYEDGFDAADAWKRFRLGYGITTSY